MAMGRRRKQVRQEGLRTPTAALPLGASHPFYHRLNQILDEKKFDEYVEDLRQRFYAAEVGRPGIGAGIYFRLLMGGYFEGIDSERGIFSFPHLHPACGGLSNAPPEIRRLDDLRGDCSMRFRCGMKIQVSPRAARSAFRTNVATRFHSSMRGSGRSLCTSGAYSDQSVPVSQMLTSGRRGLQDSKVAASVVG